MTLKIVERPELGKIVTPLLDRGLPVYRWFLAKESFSKWLVMLLAKTWGLKRREVVLDPFCGAGTTLLACLELGVNSIGCDAHPMMVLTSRVKIGKHDPKTLTECSRELFKSRYRPVKAEIPKFVARAFHPRILEDIVFYRELVSNMAEEEIRNFMRLALAVSAMKCSWAVKDGAATKVVKRSVLPFKRMLMKQVRGMIRDIERIPRTDAEVKVVKGDARSLGLKDSNVDAVITSPPYLFKKEYLYAYRLESWAAGVEEVQENNILGSGGDETQAYFRDMRRVMREICRVCRNGAKICLVVSDACSPEGVVEVCKPLCEIAEEEGLRAKRMIVVNRRYCTTPSRKKLGLTNEALLMLEKP